jgi:hypothetical protein
MSVGVFNVPYSKLLVEVTVIHVAVVAHGYYVVAHQTIDSCNVEIPDKELHVAWIV